MRVSVLTSGSTGNTSLIETKKHKILMDVGSSGKKIKDLLARVGIDIKDIDVAFLSYDHSDRSKGLGVLTRRYLQMNVSANSGTWRYLTDENKAGKLPVEQINATEPGQVRIFDDLETQASATSHDAAQSQYYVPSSVGKWIAFLTDTGYVSEKVCDVIRDGDAYMLGFNYDNESLRNGPYSWQLKQRIMPNYGRLSNEQASEVSEDVLIAKTKHIFLTHRSQHNNTSHLARDTLVNNLVGDEVDYNPQLKITGTDPDIPTDPIKI